MANVLSWILIGWTWILLWHLFKISIYYTLDIFFPSPTSFIHSKQTKKKKKLKGTKRKQKIHSSSNNKTYTIFCVGQLLLDLKPALAVFGISSDILFGKKNWLFFGFLVWMTFSNFIYLKFHSFIFLNNWLIFRCVNVPHFLLAIPQLMDI